MRGGEVGAHRARESLCTAGAGGAQRGAQGKAIAEGGEGGMGANIMWA